MTMGRTGGKKSIESRIRFKAVLLYTSVAAICAVLLWLVRLGNGMEAQKERARIYYEQLEQTGQLVRAVNGVQTEANMYISTRRWSHIAAFREKLSALEMHLDSVIAASQDSVWDSLLTEITDLLRGKGRVISELNRQLTSDSPLESLSETIRSIEGIPPRGSAPQYDSVVTHRTVYDTVIAEAPRRGFFRRLFSSTSKADTVVTATLHADTVRVARGLSDSLSAVAAQSALEMVSAAAEEARRSYASRINAIERNVNDLVAADQQLSSRISELLIRLYSQTVYSGIEQLAEREETVRRTNRISVAAGMGALVVILIFILMIIRDVNRGKAARVALEEANEHIRRIMESRHKLLLSVSHDVKTPLNSILGYLELSSGAKSLSTSDIASMQNSGKHILSLLDNLLRFSSLEQGSLTAEQTDFGLYSLCSEVAGMFTPLAGAKGLGFVAVNDFDPALTLHSDLLKIKQIVINLISNAVKYTSGGEVGFETRYADGELSFRVWDTGIGIPEEDLQAVFRPFTRVEQNSHAAEGSGLGMYVVKGLVDLLSGRIDIESRVGEGTTVSVVIPAARAESSPAETDAAPKRVLVIDDDAVLLRVLGEMIGKLGHSCVTCDGRESLCGLEGGMQGFDAVITDMEMAGYSGRDALAWLKGGGYAGPVAVMTGRGDYGAADAARDGFDRFIAKPVTMDSLAALLGRAAGQAQAQAASIYEMFGDDDDMLAEVLGAFLASGRENLAALKDATSAGDFATVRSLCHKMRPMFAQCGAPDSLTSLMAKADRADGTPYAWWRRDAESIVAAAEKFLDELRLRHSL